MASYPGRGSESANDDALMSEARSLAPPLTGSGSQIEWAERIRREANDEFDRIARCFRSVAATQQAVKRVRTESILTILEDQRQAVMSRTEAGYFIRNWQDISDQVRQMIGSDPRYQALKTATGGGELDESS